MVGYYIVDRGFNPLTTQDGQLLFVPKKAVANQVIQKIPGAYKALATECKKSELNHGQEIWKRILDGCSFKPLVTGIRLDS